MILSKFIPKSNCDIFVSFPYFINENLTHLLIFHCFFNENLVYCEKLNLIFNIW